TRKPDGNDDGYVGVTYGAYDRTEVRGAAGLTLVPDTLFARFAGTSRSSDGYVTRYDYACANNLPAPGTVGGLPNYQQSANCELGTEGGQSYTSGRMQLRWVVADNFEANLAASIVNDDSESQPGVLVAAKDHSNSLIFDPTQGSLVPIWYDNGAVGGGTAGVYNAGVDIPYDNRFATGGTYINYATYIDDGTSTPHPLFQGSTPGANTQVYKPYVIDPVNELEAWDVSLNLDWQLTDNIGLLYVMAYREYQNDFAEDTDGSPLAVQQLLQVMEHTQWTHELRMNATIFDGKVDTTLGWFYLDQETNENARVDLPYVGFDFIHGPDLVPSSNWAIYGHATWHVMDKVDVSAGLRYSEDEKSYTFHRRNPDLTPVQPCVAPPFFFFFNPAGCGVYGLDGLPVSYSSDTLDWRTALSYDINDDVMAYFQVASGYKAGGNNARPFFPSQLNAFDPEKLITYELGMKSTWWDQLRLNAAVFWNDYTSIQLPTNECTWANPGETTPCASQNNVGDAEVWGIELEAEWHATDALSFDASYSHLDFEYSNIATLASGLPASAVTLDMISPYTPEDKWSIGAQYEWILDNDLGSVTPRIDASYQGDVFGAAVNAPENLIDSYALVNARLTWRSPSDNWEVAAEFTNLADKYYYQTMFDLWGPVGYVHGQPGRPAEWALSVKRRF
ncbi:MAG: TonB-dependent receptor, partial [Gammaproteobacteria bacterium]|nr:TonB-dependent receptor [Gammaproteobacteria bacterium]